MTQTPLDLARLDLEGGHFHAASLNAMLSALGLWADYVDGEEIDTDRLMRMFAVLMGQLEPAEFTQANLLAALDFIATYPAQEAAR